MDEYLAELRRLLPYMKNYGVGLGANGEEFQNVVHRDTSLLVGHAREFFRNAVNAFRLLDEDQKLKCQRFFEDVYLCLAFLDKKNNINHIEDFISPNYDQVEHNRVSINIGTWNMASISESIVRFFESLHKTYNL